MYHINEKTDAIWGVLSAMYIQSRSETVKTYKTVDVMAYEKAWKDWGDMKDDKMSIDRETQIFKSIRIVMYIIGSFLIISSKFKKN